jgi:hypothetical protein
MEAGLDSDDRDALVARFRAVVNMEPADLRSWLKTAESKAVGWPKDRGPDEESVGHASGRRILRLLGKSQDRLTDDDLKHMRKVIGYVHRHLKQRPKGDVAHRPWRYSLMNWGHDQLK